MNLATDATVDARAGTVHCTQYIVEPAMSHMTRSGSGRSNATFTTGQVAPSETATNEKLSMHAGVCTLYRDELPTAEGAPGRHRACRSRKPDSLRLLSLDIPRACAPSRRLHRFKCASDVVGSRRASSGSRDRASWASINYCTGHRLHRVTQPSVPHMFQVIRALDGATTLTRCTVAANLAAKSAEMRKTENVEPDVCAKCFTIIIVHFRIPINNLLN